jgi:uncharacterized protein (DUF1330 family)
VAEREAPPPTAAIVIGRIAVRDALAWDDYRSRVPATLEPFGGTVVLRAADGLLLGGPTPGAAAAHAGVVVLRFPSARHAQEWFDSPQYQAIVPLRERAADVVLTLYPHG